MGTPWYEITSVRQAVNGIHTSYVQAKSEVTGKLDRDVRHPEWTRRLLDAFGQPDHQAYTVSVTGSKGKGSHSIILASLLQRIGYRVGLFTSPHLVDYMERFRIDGSVMPEPDFVAFSRDVVKQAASLAVPHGQYIGPVGMLAVISALWFEHQRTTVNVYECGRGALHDDVNQIRHQGAVLTPVFPEHAAQLGPTLPDIAREKAGILTTDTRWLVSHPQEPVVWSAVTERFAQTGSVALRLDQDFGMVIADRPDHVVLSLTDSANRSPRLLFPKRYKAFAVNAAVALRAALQTTMELQGVNPLPATIDVRDLQLPGRLHGVRQEPYTIIDGTIHAKSAKMVVQWVHANRRAGARVGAILGLPTDKDGAGVLATLAPVMDWCVLTRAHNPHLKFDDEWYRLAKSQGLDVTMAADIAEADLLACRRLQATDLLLVLGTQSFVGDSLTYYGADSRSIWLPGADSGR